MRKVVHVVHSSVDGRIDGPDGEFDWPVFGPQLSAYSHELTDRVDTFLYGRVVWEMMSGFWPHAESMSDDPHDLRFAPVWRRTPKVVFSRTLRSADWNARVAADAVTEVTALRRQQGGDLLLTGGSTVVAALAAHGLVDEYHVVVHPVVLGGGRPLFPERAGRHDLRLVGSRTFDGRSVLLHYQPARADR